MKIGYQHDWRKITTVNNLKDNTCDFSPIFNTYEDARADLLRYLWHKHNELLSQAEACVRYIIRYTSEE